MVSEELTAAAAEIQRSYPLVYLACHVQHTRRRSTEHDLSAQDAAYLAHLSREHPLSPHDLARHLGVADSTLSAFVKRMQQLGYVERAVSSRDRRGAELRLTERGEDAIRATSVLDLDRLRLCLARLSERERRRAVEGLRLLAQACRAAEQDHEQGSEPTCSDSDDEDERR